MALVEGREHIIKKLLIPLAAKTLAAGVDEAVGVGKEGNKGEKGTGTICFLSFSNLEMLSHDGTWFAPYITMGHELIHCLHMLEGRMKQDGKKEEYFTCGIKGYEAEQVTENKLRQEAGFTARTKYFATD